MYIIYLIITFLLMLGKVRNGYYLPSYGAASKRICYFELMKVKTHDGCSERYSARYFYSVLFVNLSRGLYRALEYNSVAR